MSHPLFTIGHSNRSIAEFISLLKENDVTTVADVRSVPYSRRNPQFNRDTLEDALALEGIHYTFLGEELGARRKEPECYEAGKARYELIAMSPLFLTGLERLNLIIQSHRVAMMCAEEDPLTCHRTILVCRQIKINVDHNILHILGPGNLETQSELENRLLTHLGLPPFDLFGTASSQLARAYDIQGDRIAYCTLAGDRT